MHDVPDRLGAPHGHDDRRPVGLVAQQRGEVAAEKATGLVGDRVEDARLRRSRGDQLGHAPQRGLLIGKASEVLPCLRASRRSRLVGEMADVRFRARHVDHHPT